MLELENEKLKQELRYQQQEIVNLKSRRSNLLQSPPQGETEDARARSSELQARLDQADSEISRLKRLLAADRGGQSEPGNSKQQLQYYIDVNEQLKKQNEDILADNLEMKSREKSLREQELKSQETIMDLRRRLREAECERDRMLAQKERHHSQEKLMLAKSMNRLMSEKERLASEMQEDMYEQRHKNIKMKDSLVKLERENSLLKSRQLEAQMSANVWKERTLSAEREKEIELQRAQLLRHKSLEQIRQLKNEETQYYQNRLRQAQQEVVRKDVHLDHARRQISRLGDQSKQLERQKDLIRSEYQRKLDNEQFIREKSLEEKEKQIGHLAQNNRQLTDLLNESIEEKHREQARGYRQQQQLRSESDELHLKLLSEQRLNRMREEQHHAELKQVERSLSSEIQKQAHEKMFYKEAVRQRDHIIEREMDLHKKIEDRTQQQVGRVAAEAERWKYQANRSQEKFYDQQREDSHKIDYLNRSLEKQAREHGREVDRLHQQCQLKKQEADIWKDRFYKTSQWK